MPGGCSRLGPGAGRGRFRRGGAEGAACAHGPVRTRADHGRFGRLHRLVSDPPGGPATVRHPLVAQGQLSITTRTEILGGLAYLKANAAIDSDAIAVISNAGQYRLNGQ